MQLVHGELLPKLPRSDEALFLAAAGEFIIQLKRRCSQIGGAGTGDKHPREPPPPKRRAELLTRGPLLDAFAHHPAMVSPHVDIEQLCSLRHPTDVAAAVADARRLAAAAVVHNAATPWRPASLRAPPFGRADHLARLLGRHPRGARRRELRPQQTRAAAAGCHANDALVLDPATA